jgi:hypothetical protein
MSPIPTWGSGTRPTCDSPDGHEATSSGRGASRDQTGSHHRHLCGDIVVLVGRSGSSKNLIPLLTMEENLLLPLDLNGRPPG